MTGLSSELFEELILRLEGETLDFKSAPYDFSTEHGRMRFVKDVVAMANTPRGGDAHIVIGVKAPPGGPNELLGVTSHPDDAELRQYFSQIDPQPSFEYLVHRREGQEFGILQIARSHGPLRPLKDLGGDLLRQNQVYFRRGSQNAVASPEDVARIVGWFGGIAAPPTTGTWAELEERLQGFHPSGRYVLVASPLAAEQLAGIDGLAFAPWMAVIDFDPESEERGLLSVMKDTLGSRRSVHLVTLDDRRTGARADATEWVFARGLSDRVSTRTDSGWRTWKQTSGASLAQHLERLAASAAPSPTTVVAIWSDLLPTQYLRSLVERILDTFDQPDIVFVGDGDELARLATEVDAIALAIPLNQLASGVRQLAGHASVGADQDIALPASSGATVIVSGEDARWLEEELELVHTAAGSVPEAVATAGTFLRGAEVSWAELTLGYDVPRDVVDKLLRRVRDELDSRRPSRVNLYHAPGAGGSTVARRVVWNLQAEYPSATLRRTEPIETIDRLSRVVSQTGLPILLLVDGATIAAADVDRLFDLAKSRSLPVVFLQVLRRFTEQRQGPRAFFLELELSTAEANRFVNVYGRARPDRIDDLSSLAQETGRRRSAFHFALTAFHKEFTGIESFVRARLEALSGVARDVLLHISVSHHYGQRAIPAQAFSHQLGVPTGRMADLRAALPDETLTLLVEHSPGTWRTAHELIAEELIQQLLAFPHGDRRIWRQRLSTTANDFAAICRGTAPVPSSELLELARRVFIYRDNTELLGTERAGSKQFARLIEDIPSEEGKLSVLEQLTDLWPQEAHFWAHLGRFHSLVRRNHESAGEALSRALELDDGDSVLHHMRGMALRQHAYQMIDEAVPVGDVISVARRASRSFERCRELAPDEEHGYITDAQMLIRLLEYASRGERDGVAGAISSGDADPFLRDALDGIETLLAMVRRNREGQGPSEYEERCRAQVHQLYGRHERSLEVLTNLLSRPDVYRPPVRRELTYIYLSRRDGSFDALTAAELQRITSLLEENLVEEPNSDRNLRLWLQAIRRSPQPPPLDLVIERVGYWRTASESLDAYFYLYVLYALRCLDGAPTARDQAIAYMEECQARARSRRNRHKSFEWLGRGDGLRRLVHQSQLGNWAPSADFWDTTEPLDRVEGRISRIDGPQSGRIEIPGGLPAFFVPGRSGYARGRSENRRVSAYIGFSYDGIRAWEVRDASLPEVGLAS